MAKKPTKSPTAAAPAKLIPFRVHRSWTWERVPGVEVRMGGGPAPVELVPRETFEVEVDGQWVPAPVFEDPKPEHPTKAAERAQAKQTRKDMLALAEHLPGLAKNIAKPTR